jgi:alpha-D-ribose 1-methylphosphonate 5-phosphate C-P lyase
MSLIYTNISGNTENTLIKVGSVETLHSISFCNKHTTNTVSIDVYFWKSTLPNGYDSTNYNDQTVIESYYLLKNMTMPKGTTLILNAEDLAFYDQYNYSFAVKLSDADSDVDVIRKNK